MKKLIVFPVIFLTLFFPVAAGAQDTDGDHVVDSEDAFPHDPEEWSDSDGDGVGNNKDAVFDQSWELMENTEGLIQRHEFDYIKVSADTFISLGGRESNVVNCYNPNTDIWSSEAKAPVNLHHFQTILYDNKLYIVGAMYGGGYPNEQSMPDIHTYDLVKQTWFRVGKIPEARVRGGASAVLYQDKIYLLGGNTRGHNGGYVNWFDVYDPRTGDWTRLENAPHARDHHRAIVYRDVMYVIGGRRTDQSNKGVLSDTVGPVDVYNFKTGTWHVLEHEMPTPRAGGGAVTRGRDLVYVGGESEKGHSAAAEVLDVVTGNWISLPNLNKSRNGTGAVACGNVIYVLNGQKKDRGDQEKIYYAPNILRSVDALCLGTPHTCQH